MRCARQQGSWATERLHQAQQQAALRGSARAGSRAPGRCERGGRAPWPQRACTRPSSRPPCVTAPEQEHVISRPPGATSRSARALSCRYFGAARTSACAAAGVPARASATSVLYAIFACNVARSCLGKPPRGNPQFSKRLWRRRRTVRRSGFWTEAGSYRQVATPAATARCCPSQHT